MPDPTPRLGLNRWAQGEKGWTYTDTVEALDELAIDRGTLGERPSSGDYDDQLYLAIDDPSSGEATLYRWDEDASAWGVFSRPSTKADLTGEGGVLVSSQVPDLAITETFTVADESARLGLSDVEEGDVAIQQDTSETYLFTGGDSSDTANWSQIVFDAAADPHDNAAHSEEFVSDGDGTTRQVWVIGNGASDPAGAGPDDLIFEEES